VTCRTPYYSAIHGILWRIHLNDIFFVLYVIAVQEEIADFFEIASVPSSKDK
jgi:hypothetical protein